MSRYSPTAKMLARATIRYLKRPRPKYPPIKDEVGDNIAHIIVVAIGLLTWYFGWQNVLVFTIFILVFYLLPTLLNAVKDKRIQKNIDHRAEEQKNAEADFLKFIEKIKSEAEAEILARTNTTELIHPLNEWEVFRLKRLQKDEVTKLMRQKLRLSPEYSKLRKKLEKPPLIF